MDISQPYKALCPSIDGEVLVTLAGTKRPLTGRELTRLIGRRSNRGVSLVLDRMVEHGLVGREEIGNANLYTLNRDHIAAPAVEILAGMRTTLIDRLRKAITAWKMKPTHLSLFGSAARGDGNAESDIDIFVVRPQAVQPDDRAWRDQLDGLYHDVLAWTGNHMAAAELGEYEIEQISEKNPLIEALRADAITLFGNDISNILSEVE